MLLSKVAKSVSYFGAIIHNFETDITVWQQPVLLNISEWKILMLAQLKIKSYFPVNSLQQKHETQF